MSEFSDKVLMCRDCGNEFTFSGGEQEFYAMRGFSEPMRCPECRAARKSARDGGGSGDGGYRAGGGYGRGGGSTTGVRQMFKVTCAECGTETEVPFEPRNGRPVYCRDCFERRNDRR